MASGDANLVPIKNRAYRVSFPIFDDTGSLVAGAAGLDSEISKDGGTFADCANEATQIATSSGMYFLDLTSSEMSTNTAVIKIKSTTTDSKDTPIVLYPRSANDFGVRQQKSQHVTPAGFDERPGPTSAKITRATFPDYGAVHSASTTPTNTDFDGNVLIGSVIIEKDTENPFIILGGYFFNDSTDTTEKVFGIALDSRFGVTEGGSTIINTNWTGAGAEATFGDGWTFIVINSNHTFPSSNDVLEIWLEPSILRGTFVSENSAGVTCPTVVQIVDGVWDELKSAHTVANSFGDFVDIEISSRSDFDETTDPVELLDSGGSAGTSADELVDDIWNELSSAHVVAGSFGLFVDLAISSRSDFDETTDPVELLDTGGSAGKSADELVNDIWDELQSGHTTAGTFGKFVDVEISSVSGASAGAIADAVWDEATSGHVAAGSFGNQVGALLLTDANYKDFETQITVTDTQTATPDKIPKIYTRGTSGNLKTITVTVDGDDVVSTEIGV